LKENLLENYGPHHPSHGLGTKLLLPLLHFLHLGGYKCGNVLARDEQESPQIHLYLSHDVCIKPTT
jgi:hypothetical protein